MGSAENVARNEPASVVAIADGNRLKSLVRGAFLALGLILTSWNLYLLTVCFAMMPKNDFGRPLWDTIAFLRGQPMYAPSIAVHFRFDQSGSESVDLWNLNPPHFQLLLLPFAVLEPTLALLIWCLMGGVCLVLSLRIILQEVPFEVTRDRRPWIALGVLSFSGMGSAMVTGHLSFPLMLLVTLVWRDARHGRWTRAGGLLGLGMSVKPFLLIFIPYLVLKRRWRGVAAAGLTACLCFLLGLAVFGIENHRAWLRRLGTADSWAWLPMNASLFGFLRRALTDNPFYASLANLDPGTVRWIWLCLGAPAGLLALAVSLNDASKTGIDRAFALLLVSALLLSPLGWTYYFWLPLGPVAVLARAWWSDRPVGEDEQIPAQRLLLLLAMPGLFSPFFVTIFYQPQPLATVFYGGFVFWSLLLVWLALILDGFLKRYPCRGTVAPAETFGAERRVARLGPGSIAS
jgi:hypothetical protein